MSQTKRSRKSRGLSPIHPAAAAIDIGATMHVAAVGLDYAAAHIQHMQKALMQMNLQLHHVLTDITGVTGLSIIRAIVAGERDPSVLASHLDRRCQASVETVCQALAGNYRAEHIFALTQARELYDAYQTKVLAATIRSRQS